MNILDEIVLHKLKEIDLLMEREKKDPHEGLKKILESDSSQEGGHFYRALKVAGLSIIGEIKRRSPSRGTLAHIQDPAKLAHIYSKAGVSAISVLTDEKYFGGSKQDLIDVAKSFSVPHPPPILRKDFILNPYQIAESKKIGAHAILLIVSLLQEKLQTYLEIATRIGLDVLVEVHSEEELEIAIAAEAQIIGVNNRNLKTFELDLNVAKELSKKIPPNVLKIAESGILTLEGAKEMHECGYDGILVGEMLVTSKDPEKLIAQLGNI